MMLSPPKSATRERKQPLLICFSHLRWDFVFQRPQQLLTRAARHMRVIFVEEPIFERDAAARLELQMREPNVLVVTPHLPRGLTDNECVFLQRSLINGLLASQPDGPRIMWYYSPMAVPFTRHLKANVCIYDCMDELSGFRGAPEPLKEMERQLFGMADVVFTGGHSLYEAKRRQHVNVHAFPSSVDKAHFERARLCSDPEPAELAGLPRPRLTYFGVVDERLDMALLDGVAALRPDWSIVMIGPVVKISEDDLPRRPNIHWLGGRQYADLPCYLAHTDVGIMPFAHNEATRFISPTKTPEFLAAGVPVVSTSIRDVVRPYGESGLVAIADDAEAFVANVEGLLARKGPEWLERVDRQLATTSWDSTWRSMLALLQLEMDRKSRAERGLRKSMLGELSGAAAMGAIDAGKSAS
jgi:glycosyltransferase involved in cell wall biosynthesis